jgi:7-cyano-7-deazaguanine reductase
MRDEIPLGKSVPYPEQYSPELLFEVPRAEQRERLGIGPDLPFHGTDIWNAWELSWLDHDGKPRCAIAEIRVPADSLSIIESKSLKLYLNSFAMTHYATQEDVMETIEQDLSDCAGADVEVSLQDLAAAEGAAADRMPGDCLDALSISCNFDEVAPQAALLRSDPDEIVTEELYTHLLRSLCPVTSQPDTGSVLVRYTGPRIDREGLLRYIVSFRQHEDFHESCVERMFIDIVERCQPEKLTVYARYQRRGGIDINPFRSNFEAVAPNARLWRQ